MAAANLSKPLEIEQGATWDFILVWKYEDGSVVDLTDCQGRMQFRRFPNAPIVLDLSTEDETLSFDPSSGRIIAQVDAQTTSEITESSGVFDLEVTFPDGRVTRVIQGRWVLSLEVTK